VGFGKRSVWRGDRLPRLRRPYNAALISVCATRLTCPAYAVSDPSWRDAHAPSADEPKPVPRLARMRCEARLRRRNRSALRADRLTLEDDVGLTIRLDVLVGHEDRLLHAIGLPIALLAKLLAASHFLTPLAT
jgi:hypothetical protein